MIILTMFKCLSFSLNNNNPLSLNDKAASKQDLIGDTDWVMYQYILSLIN